MQGRYEIEKMATGIRPNLLLIFLFLGLCTTARANVCVYKTLHVLHVEGHVINQLEDAVPRAIVLIKRGKETIAESVADQEGNFRIKVPAGEYELDIQAAGYAPAHAHIKVGFGVRSVFHSSSIKMVLSPVVICSNARSPIYLDVFPMQS